jgi:hypothetical protein
VRQAAPTSDCTCAIARTEEPTLAWGPAATALDTGPRHLRPRQSGWTLIVNVNVNELRLGFSNTSRNPDGFTKPQQQKELTSLPLIHASYMLLMGIADWGACHERKTEKRTVDCLAQEPEGGGHAPLDTDAQCTGLKVTSALRHLAGGKKGRYPPSICGAQKRHNDNL